MASPNACHPRAYLGVTYGTDIEIKNIGIDACRFRIRQPPLGTGLRVVFQPGFVRSLLLSFMTGNFVFLLYSWLPECVDR